MGDTAKVVFILLSALVPVGAEHVRGRAQRPGTVARGRRGLALHTVAVPHPARAAAALPSIATGVHLALIYAWVASVGAEYYMTVGPGIGGLIIAGANGST